MDELVGTSLLRSANPLPSAWAWRKRFLTTRDTRQLRNTLTSYTGTSTQMHYMVVTVPNDAFPSDYGNAHGKMALRYGFQNRRPRMTPLKFIVSNSKANTTNSQVMDKRTPLHNAHQHSFKPEPRKPALHLQESMLRAFTAAYPQYQAFLPTASLSEKPLLVLDGIRVRSSCSRGSVLLLQERRKRPGRSMLNTRPILVWLVVFPLSARLPVLISRNMDLMSLSTSTTRIYRALVSKVSLHVFLGLMQPLISLPGIFKNFKLVEKDKAWTPRMVGEKVGFGGFGPMPVGTPSQVADVMEQWFTEADIDGFNIQCKHAFIPLTIFRR